MIDSIVDGYTPLSLPLTQKLKEKGINNDPALGDGWAHWVQSAPYQAYIKNFGHQVEVYCDLLDERPSADK